MTAEGQEKGYRLSAERDLDAPPEGKVNYEKLCAGRSSYGARPLR
jgi:hypothetical protein